MAWEIIYFVIGIVLAVVGIWNLAQRRFIFLSIVSLLFFLVALFSFIVKIGIISFELVPGTPLTSVGNIVVYGVIPIFIILAFFTRTNR
jgi:hypothetical protein